MLELSICVGSACHLKGSYCVIEQFKQCIKENNLENDIIIKGAFCLGHCTEAVSVQFENEIYSVVPSTAKDFFNNTVLGRINK
ncbi:NAD(P)H-dependent oxidoreductase subunit E [Sedimentibacter sp. zth1]|uniref:(2Fe-2S) ferredoxin domain-containing protein n=1 Tax=Sedimentibacter sp. zth1 TaxID=2816908 RepID=UPI001A926BBB|nr:NAD(P)H-dependent oxidoreductase subunit E [Sedimentibacter sp. zth1]QSX05822.1 NAD(P)H-dependent oxidoreductase subunit E [Sedimentibacter sp. zth1]